MREKKSSKNNYFFKCSSFACTLTIISKFNHKVKSKPRAFSVIKALLSSYLIE